LTIGSNDENRFDIKLSSYSSSEKFRPC